MSALAEIQRRVQATIALIEQHERSAVQSGAPNAVFANIRALEKLRNRLEKQFQDIAGQEEMEVCRYRLMVDAESLTLAAVASAWQNFQRVLTLTHDAVVNGPKETSRVRFSERAATAFRFGYTFAGSVGVVITLPSDHMQTNEPSLLGATETVFNLAKAQTTEQVVEFARRLGAPPIRAMYQWADVHVKNELGAGIEWISPDQSRISLLVQKEELARLRDLIGETSQSDETTMEVSGDLVAVDTASHRFKLITENERILGMYGEAIGFDRTVEIPARYTATIRRTTKVQYSTESVEVLNFLLSIRR
jgi:hypothetical protein